MDVLSQDVIDQLLAAVTTNNSDDDSKEKPAESKRPEPFTNDNFRVIQMIHEIFAKKLSDYFSNRFQIEAKVEVMSVDQLTYDEFIRSIPSPSMLSIVNFDPLKGKTVLEISLPIAHAMIDKTFNSEAGVYKNHEITRSEMPVMEEIVTNCLLYLKEGWKKIIDLQPKLNSTEATPNLCHIVHPDEMVVLITFDFKLNQIEGLMNLCIPHLVVKSLMDKLTMQYWFYNNEE